MVTVKCLKNRNNHVLKSWELNPNINSPFEVAIITLIVSQIMLTVAGFHFDAQNDSLHIPNDSYIVSHTFGVSSWSIRMKTLLRMCCRILRAAPVGFLHVIPHIGQLSVFHPFINYPCHGRQGQ